MEISGEEIMDSSSAMHPENIDLSIENVPENGDSLNHRNLLSEAVKMEHQEKFLEFAWGMEMQVEEVPLKPFRVVEVDLNIQVPVSLQNIQLLKDISKNAYADKENKFSFGHTSGQGCEIGASKIYGSNHEDLDISSMIISHLQLPNEMNIAAKFKKLVLYAGPQCFTNNLGSCWVDGKFGTLLLQLPVEGGHEGGHINIEYHGRKKKFESHTNSDKTFYLSSFYDCCEHFIEPVLQGHKLMLVFDLIWTNAKIEIPRNFPVFLTALKQMKKAIKSWLYNPLLNSRKKDETQPVIHSDCSPSGFLANSSPTIATEAFFIKNDSLNSEADFYHSEERRGRVFAEALLQCSCLDVHLALAKRKIQNVRRENSIDVEQFESFTNPEKSKVFEVSHFIDSNNVTRNLSIELNWDEQYVGTIQPDQEKMANKEDCERQVEIDQTSSHYDYGWAREEGLDLLRILGSNFEEKINGGVAYCECNFEGIQNEEVAYAIAKFECQVAGWNVIADLVKKLVTPERIAKQLIPICKLSKFFLNLNCIEGARVVGDCVSSSFDKTDKTQVSKSKLCDVQAYVDMIVVLETNRDTADPEKIASFVLFFSKLKPSLQCRLTLDFTAQKNHFLGSLHSWQFIFRDLCEILSVSCKIQSPPAKTLAFDFMKAIEAWLLELSQEIELRPELKELVEPHIKLEYVELNNESITSHKSVLQTIQASVIVTEEPEKLPVSGGKSECQGSLELWDTSTAFNSQGDTLIGSSELGAPTDDWTTATKESNSACNLTISPAIDCDDWNAASDAWTSKNESPHASSEKTVGKAPIDDDWGAKADSCKTDSFIADSCKTDYFIADSTEKEIAPRPNETQSVDDWGACADAWASNSKTTSHATKAGTNSGNQSDWDQPDNVSASSSRPIASEHCGKWSNDLTRSAHASETNTII